MNAAKNCEKASTWTPGDEELGQVSGAGTAAGVVEAHASQALPSSPCFPVNSYHPPGVIPIPYPNTSV